MPFQTVTITQDIGPSTNLGPGTADMVFALGDLPDQFQTGGFALSFLPSDDFVGSFVILGRHTTKDAVDKNANFVPYPFRAYSLNGNPSDLSMQSSGTPITGRSDLLVPASGQRIGFQVATFSQGNCWVFVQAVVGSTAP